MKNVVVLMVTFSFLTIMSMHAQKRHSRGQEGGLITVGASALKFSKVASGSGRIASRIGIIGGEFGYAHPIGEKNSIGANVFYNANTDQNDIKTNIVTIQPEFRNYFSDGAFDGVYLAINGEYQNQRTVFGNSNFSNNNFGVGLGAGYNLVFGDRFSGAINAGFDYILNNNQNTGQTSPQSTTQWIIGLGIGIRLE
jgi:hypothetical protein